MVIGCFCNDAPPKMYDSVLNTSLSDIWLLVFYTAQKINFSIEDFFS